MIEYLRLQNFRSHEDTELRFDLDDQLVFLAGANGSGKTSIFAAISYAITGEGPHGRRHLDRLVRAGADTPLEVELVLNLAGARWRVLRRRDGRSSTAALHADGMLVVEGPAEVTAELARLLGVDGVGFRLAYYAAQGDLDGLASLRPADRATQLGRLLRLDRVAKARDAARSDGRRLRDQAHGISMTLRLPEARQAATELADEVAVYETAVNDSQDAIVKLEAELTNGAELTAQRAALAAQQAEADGHLAAARAELDAIDERLAALHIPDTGPAARPFQEVSQELAVVERAIHDGELVAERIAARQTHLNTITRVDQRRGEIAGELARLVATYPQDLDHYRQEVRDLEAHLTTLRARERDAAKDAAVAEHQVAELRARAETAGTLGATCDHCGQTITATFRAQHLAELEAALHDAQTVAAAAAETAAQQRSRCEQVEREVAGARRTLEGAEGAASQVAGYTREATDLCRRRDVAVAAVERFGTLTPVDLDPLYVRRAELVAELTTAREAADRDALRQATLERADELNTARAQAAARVLDAQQRRGALEPDEATMAAWVALDATAAALSDEQDLLHHLETSLAACRARWEAAQRTLSDTEAAAGTHRRLEADATVAGDAAALLEFAVAQLTAEIRPGLAAATGELLTQMTDGRFSAVRFDDSYDCEIADVDGWRRLEDCSGGEQDLVALAVRLGLARVATERNGNTGASFLLLDEILGSQDAERRSNILDALRRLRGVWGQIFVVSHIPGLDEAADRVIELSRNEHGSAITA